MAQKFEIVTPENITVEYEVAGLGSRGCAVIIDELTIYLLVLLTALAALLVAGGLEGLLDGLSRTAMALLTVIIFFVYTGYYTAFEILLRGQTPGKRLMKLEVIQDDGRTLTWQSAALRNLLRPADYVGFYFVGIFVAFCNLQSKRIGDFAAGTIVIKKRQRLPERTQAPEISPSYVRTTYLTLSHKAIIAQLPLSEMQPVLQLVSRLEQLPPDVSAKLTGDIGAKFIQKLQLEQDVDKTSLLKEVAEVWQTYQR